MYDVEPLSSTSSNLPLGDDPMPTLDSYKDILFDFPKANIRYGWG